MMASLILAKFIKGAAYPKFRADMRWPLRKEKEEKNLFSGECSQKTQKWLFRVVVIDLVPVSIFYLTWS